MTNTTMPPTCPWAEDLAAVARQAWLALADGRRIVVNVANSGRKPYLDLATSWASRWARPTLNAAISSKGFHTAGTARGSTRMASAPACVTCTST